MVEYRRLILSVSLGVALAALLSPQAYAHCDGMDGPVVRAAQDALEKGDVNLALIWVQEKDEAEIREAFDRTTIVRKLSPLARELADESFFEALVRIHRAAEGAPFTGLKPAGRDLGPAIPAADLALQSGDATPLTNLLLDRIRDGLADRYKEVVAAKAYKAGDVDAGRKYVEAYVTFMHYVEGVYEAATHQAQDHSPDEGSPVHKEE